MDRNLGASRVATSMTDGLAYGDLYQWSRLTDGHEQRTSPTTATLCPSDVSGNGNFITAPSSPHDWRSPQNANLWQGVSGVNNPCPSGFRLPTETEWETERASWGINNNSTGGLSSPLKLVPAGHRFNGDGTLHFAGSNGFYWSATVDGSLSRYLTFDSDNVNMNNGSRARGRSVRCLKD
jgi:hypothetical protein